MGASPFVILACVIALAAALPAWAQFIDRAALEELFGEPVTLSATGRPQRAGDVPAHMRIVTAEEIRRSGATSIPEVLERLSGLDVRRYGPDSFDVNVRGYNQGGNPRLLVLVDGRQVYLDHFGLTNWSAVPVVLEEIRQIEVVKGPSGALFGFNAASGVVNIVTRDPLARPLAAATAAAGSGGYRHGSAVGTARLGRDAAVRLSTSYRDDDAFAWTRPADAPYVVDPYRRTALADVRARLSDRVQAGAEFGAARSVRNELLPINGQFGGAYEVLSGRLGATVETGLGLWSASLYRNRLDLRGSSDFLSPADLRNEVTVAGVSGLFDVGGDVLRLGLEYRRNEADVNPLPLKIGTIGYDVYSLSGMWDSDLAPSLSFTNAVRADRMVLERTGPDIPGTLSLNERYGQRRLEWSFNSGLVWRAGERDTLRFTVGRAVQLPSLVEYSYVSRPSPTTPGFVFGSPLIDPTAVLQAEAVWDRRLPSAGLDLRLAAYALRLDDLRATPTRVPSGSLGGFPYFEFSNVGDSRSVGAELELRGRGGDGWTWSASYGVQVVRDDVVLDAGGTRITDIDFEDATPVHRLRLALGRAVGAWELDVHLDARSATTHVDPRSNIVFSERRVPASASLGGRIAYRLRDDVWISVVGRQLQAATLSTGPGPESERRVYGAVTWRPSAR